MLRSWFVNVRTVRPCSQCTLPKIATDSISRKQKQIAAVAVKSNRRAGIKKKTNKKRHRSGVSKRVDGGRTKLPLRTLLLFGTQLHLSTVRPVILPFTPPFALPVACLGSEERQLWLSGWRWGASGFWASVSRSRGLNKVRRGRIEERSAGWSQDQSGITVTWCPCQ